jgi:hypothetical protein
VTLRIGTLEDGPASVDHEATWLLGHTERITFRHLRTAGLSLLVDAVLHVRCRFLRSTADAATGVHCTAHGFTGPAPEAAGRTIQPRQLGDSRFLVVERHQMAALRLREPPRQLPVVSDPGEENPCAIAPCETADHRRGSACCRDLQVEILCPRSDSVLEALVRSRLSPYLCKISRETDDSLEAEMISACAFLDAPATGCTLHGRIRPDGRSAKPDLCSSWPDDGKGLHPGCIFYEPPRKKPKKTRTQRPGRQ